MQFYALRYFENMKILVKSNEIIYLSWVKHILKENRIDFHIFDEFVSSVEGNINAFPIRILVSDNDFKRAKKVIENTKTEKNT